MDDQGVSALIQDKLVEDGKDNDIAEITVFLDRGLVKRKVVASTKPGLNRFAVETKAFNIDAESAQARVFGEGEILGVQYLSERVADHPQQDIHELVEQQRLLKRQYKALDADKEAIQKQKQFLDSVINFSEVQVPREIKTEFPSHERLKDMLGFLDSNFETLNKAENDLENKSEDLDKEISVIEEKIKQLSKHKNAYRNIIEVLFQSEVEQEIVMEVSYGVSNTQWHPVYKVDVPLDLKYVNLTLMARIQQNTGEHWKNAQLALSNALPMNSSTLPELQSWYLRMPRPPKPAPAVRRARKIIAEAEEIEALEDLDLEEDFLAGAAAAAPLPEATFAQADATELPIAFEYNYSRPVHIDSDNKKSLIPLFSRQLNGQFFYYAVPQMDSLVYLVCCATADSSLIEGRLNIHFGGRYIGGTRLGEKKPGEDLLLNLGAERGIKVSREKIKDSISETFFGKVDRSSVARELEYRLVIENMKDSQETIHIVDSVPVSKTDRFQVKGLEMKPSPTEADWKKRQGVMLWKLELAPQSVKEINIKFFVKHPKDHVPEGL